MANVPADKTGVFKKAIDMLSMRGSMGKAKTGYATKLNKQADEMAETAKTLNNATEYSKNYKGYIDKKDISNAEKRASGAASMLGDSDKKRDAAKGILSKKGFTGGSVGDQVKMAGSGIANYYNPMNGEGAATNALRYGATAAGVSATAIGGRYLSGGNMTTDRDGNKDIAGVPFI